MLKKVEEKVALRVPERFQSADLEHVDRKMFKPVFDYQESLNKKFLGGTGLLLSGPNGVGKTHALVALTRAALQWTQQYKKFFDYEFVTGPDFIERISMFEDRQPVDKRRNCTWFETYCRVPWLIIDDFGKEFREGGFHAQVVYKYGRVLRARNGRCLITHATMNMGLKSSPNKESVQSVYGESITSLLAEMTQAYNIQGPDRRKAKGA